MNGNGTSSVRVPHRDELMFRNVGIRGGRAGERRGQQQAKPKECADGDAHGICRVTRGSEKDAMGRLRSKAVVAIGSVRVFRSHSSISVWRGARSRCDEMEAAAVIIRLRQMTSLSSLVS